VDAGPHDAYEVSRQSTRGWCGLGAAQRGEAFTADFKEDADDPSREEACRTGGVAKNLDLTETSHRARIAWGLLLVTFTVLIYLPVTGAGFIWDDGYYVHRNPNLQNVDGLARIWFQPGATVQYYPLVFTSFWLEYRLWGLAPVGYHLVNVLLHAGAALILWRLLALLAVPGAWVAAALFAVHPVQVESVAWVAERKNVLSGILYLASAGCFLRSALRPGAEGLSPGRRAFWTSWVLFLGALLSKTVTCTLPATLLLVLWWKRGRLRVREARSLLPFFGAALVLGAVTVWMERRYSGATGEEFDLAAADRVLIAARALCFYAGKLLWPSPLVFIYPRWDVGPSGAHLLPLLPYIPCLLLVVLVPAGLWLARDRLGRAPLTAVLFFFGTFFPALGFWNIHFMKYSFVADHFQYLPCIGLLASFAAAATYLTQGLGRWRRGLRTAGAALVLVVLAGLTWRQQASYRDMETLWRDTVRKNPSAWIAHANLAALMEARRQPERALEHRRRVVEIDPTLAEGHYDLGTALASHGRWDEAIEQYGMAVRQRPAFPLAHHNLALALLSCGRIEEAIRHLEEAARLDPEWSPPLVALAWIRATSPDSSQRRPEQAIRLAERACAIGGRDARYLDALGASYAAGGRFADAVVVSRAAADLATRGGDASLAAEIAGRIRLYQGGRAYRDTTAARPVSRGAGLR
jgi:tetratricopeptide (TPR) repeat protein